MFKTIELGAWYRIRMEGRSVFGQILEQHGRSYTVRYISEEGKTSEAKVTRSSIMGRLGEAFVESLTRDAGVASDSEIPMDSPPPIVPGDWHRFEYQGETAAGVVYRAEEDRYTIFFLDNGERRFVVLDRGQVGPREERLLDQQGALHVPPTPATLEQFKGSMCRARVVRSQK